MSEKWLHTSEAADVCASIRHALRAHAATADDPHEFKWVFLALHSALQGACVCHLTTTAVPIGSVGKENAEEWLEYHEERRLDESAQPPRIRLMLLPDLLKQVRKPNSAGDRSNSDGVSISDAELQWLRRMHDDVRNQFIHFAPMGWSIEVSGLNELAQLIARITSEILEIGWAFRHLDEVEKCQLRSDLKALGELD